MIQRLKETNPCCIKGESTVKLSKDLFYIVFAFYLIFLTATDTTYRYESSTFLQILRVGMWGCYVISLINVVFLCRYKVWQLLCILAFSIFYIFIMIHNGGQTGYLFLHGMMVVCSCYYIKWDYLLRFLIIYYIPLIIVPALLEVIGVLPTISFTRSGAQRYSLGLSHPNTLGGYCLCIVILWLLIRYKKLKIWDYLGWLLIALFVWIVPNSRTSTLLILFICFLSFLFKNWGEKLLRNIVLRGLCTGSFIILAVGSFFASYFYNANSTICVKINEILFTHRLSYAYDFLHTYPVTLFGTRLKFVGSVLAQKNETEAHILDNFYINQLLTTGIISMLIILGLFTYLTYSAMKRHDQAVLIGLVVMAVWLVYENHGTNLVYNVLLFQFVYDFTGKVTDKTSERQNSCSKDNSIQLQ